MHKLLDIYKPLEFLEYVGRVAHNSLSQGDPKKFLVKMIDLGHYAVFEHLWLVGREMAPIYTMGEAPKITFNNPFHWKRWERPYASMFNARTIAESCVDLPKEKRIDYIADMAENHYEVDHPWFKFASVEITCSRACSHQIVRHRWPFTYMQESQRHVAPHTFYVPDMPYTNSAVDYGDTSARDEFQFIYQRAFNCYQELRNMGIHKEDARYVLPNGTKTRIVMTAPLMGWNHFFALRAVKTKANVPQKEIYELANGIMKDMSFVFGDLIRPERISF